MDHATAERRAQSLRREHPDRLTHTWMARGHADGAWDVVKVRIPGPRAGSKRARSASGGGTSRPAAETAPASLPPPSVPLDAPPSGAA